MRPELELDVENLVGFFSMQFRNRHTGALTKFVRHFGSDPVLFNLQRLVDLLATHTIVTFNGNNYDLPIVVLALHGATNEMLKEAGDDIIVRQLKPWQFYKKYQVQVPEYIDHIDLIEVAAGIRIGLKMYAGRMHFETMIDLPVDPMLPVPPPLYPKIISYCDNDLAVTGQMRSELDERLKLRATMSEQYGVDLRSKSDAQIAEAVIRSEILKDGARRYIDKRVIPHGYSFKYTPPDYIRFATPAMCELLATIRALDFVVSDKEEAHGLGMEEVMRTGVIIPDALKGRDIVIGEGRYRVGIGGLHSQESSVSHFTIPGKQKLKDIDVRSYYPSMILAMGMYPEQLGPAFLIIYRAIYAKRLLSKSEASRLESLGHGLGGEEGAEMLRLAKVMQTESDGLKIVLNGTFGKLFSKWSILYAPEFGIATTLTGQLLLLMLIEMMEMSGIKVASANTDGIVLVIPEGLECIATSNVAWWERATGMEMEESLYAALHSRDVNNYIAITMDGKAKRKGVFGQSGMNKNKHPDKDICAEAVVAYLKDNIPIEYTIGRCEDIRKFIKVRNVQGGGMFNGQYLGRAVRWYYGYGCTDCITDKKSGNQVAGSKGCVPAMALPKEMPLDIDRRYYCNIAFEMLADVGMPVTYWHDSDTNCYLISHAEDDSPDEWCVDWDRITQKQYEKGNKR